MGSPQVRTVVFNRAEAGFGAVDDNRCAAGADNTDFAHLEFMDFSDVDFVHFLFLF